MVRAQASSYLMLSGNSSYVASGQYNPEQRFIGVSGGFFIFGQGYATATDRQINGRTTRCKSMFVILSSGGYQLTLMDIQGGAVTSATNLPANSGWTSVTLAGTAAHGRFSVLPRLSHTPQLLKAIRLTALARGHGTVAVTSSPRQTIQPTSQ